jgi:uncharacterized protein YbjT (DUF2867 family)
MKIAIAGATGLTGSLCLQELLKNERVFEIISIGRRNTGLLHPKLREVFLIDNKLSEEIQADAYICCLGTTIKKAGSKEAFKEIDLELPLYLAKELKKNGCKTAAVVSAMGAKSGSSIFYNSVKGEMENAMKEVGFESLSILRPSIIEGPRKEKRTGEKIGLAVMRFFNPILMGSLKHYKTIQASDIAKALVKSVTFKKVGNTIYLSGEIKDLVLV